MKMIMSEIKIVETVGFNKEEALSTVAFNAAYKNATQKWIKSGSPEVDSKAFKVFAAEYLKSATKDTAGLGAHIVVEAGVADSRERPYKVISKPTEGARKYKSVHSVVPAELTTKIVKETSVNEAGEEVVKEVVKVTSYTVEGPAIASLDTKGDAIDAMKDAIAETKQSYVIINNKVEITGQDVEAFGIYTPSASTKLGTYIAFGIEA